MIILFSISILSLSLIAEPNKSPKVSAKGQKLNFKIETLNELMITNALVGRVPMQFSLQKIGDQKFDLQYLAVSDQSKPTLKKISTETAQILVNKINIFLRDFLKLKADRNCLLKNVWYVQFNKMKKQFCTNEEVQHSLSDFVLSAQMLLNH